MFDGVTCRAVVHSVQFDLALNAFLTWDAAFSIDEPMRERPLWAGFLVSSLGGSLFTPLEVELRPPHPPR